MTLHSFCWLLAAIPLSTLRSETTPESGMIEPRSQAALRFTAAKHPSLRFGELLRIDFRFKMQNDFRTFSPDLSTEEGFHDLNRARVGIEGRLFQSLEFELERELSVTQNPWKDAFVNWRGFRRVQVKAGRFKMPFGMEQLTGPTQLDFIYRAGISAYLAPGRDTGVMAHGRLLDKALSFEAGLFRHDGDNARIPDNERAAGTTFVARLTLTPARTVNLPAFLRNLELGAAATTGSVEEGANSLRGRTAAQKYFFHRLDVNGQRLRLGTELKWKQGPLAVKGEYIQVSDQRLGQGVSGNDIPNLVSRGWYLSGLWTVADSRNQKRAKHANFLQSLYGSTGPGMVQVGVRYEQLRFGSDEHTGAPSRSSRARNILGNSDRAVTFGANWVVNRHVRIQVNAVRETVEDTVRSPIPGRSRFWTRLCRLQFDL
jgi:phosphate-selective porin OprO and OprP